MEKCMPLGILHPLSFHSHKLEPLLSALPSPPLRQSLLPVSLSLSLLLPSGLPEFYFPTPPLPQLHLCSSTVLNSGVLQIFTSSLSKVELTTSNPVKPAPPTVFPERVPVLSCLASNTWLSHQHRHRHLALLRHYSKGFHLLVHLISCYV